MRKYALLSIFCFYTLCSFGQSNKIVHLYRVEAFNGSAIKFKLSINNQTCVFRNGEKLELPLTSDSIHMTLQNKRLKKNSRELHEALEDEKYILIYLKPGRAFKQLLDSVIIQTVCRECYFNNLNAAKNKKH